MPATTTMTYTLNHACVQDPTADALDSHSCDASQELTACAIKLGALRPTPLLPSRQSKRRHLAAVAALQQIERVDVSRNTQRTDRKVYFVDMYYRERQSRIPVHRHFRPSSTTSQQPATNSHKRDPSATIQVDYDEFLQVRHDAYELARASHLFDACTFCHHVIHLTTSSKLTPRWNSHWSKTDEQVGDMLAAYLTELLKVVVQAPPAEADAPCQGQKHIPRLLQSFLRSHEQTRSSV